MIYLVPLMAQLALLPFFFRAGEVPEGFGLVRLTVLFLSFMVFVIARLTVGFGGLWKLPGWFRRAARWASVLVITTLGVLVGVWGRWWLEASPHTLLALYTAWRLR